MKKNTILFIASVLLVASCKQTIEPKISAHDAKADPDSWPQRVDGNWVTKTFTFRAELVSIKARPTVVPDNLDLKFRILDKSVPAEYFSIHYPRYRERKPKLETLFGSGVQAVFQLTVDAIAIGEMSDGSGSALIGGLKTFKKE